MQKLAKSTDLKENTQVIAFHVLSPESFCRMPFPQMTREPVNTAGVVPVTLQNVGVPALGVG